MRTEATPHPNRSSADRRSTGLEDVRVWMLGSFRISVGSRTIRQDEWRLRKAASLVKLLALAPGHRLHREQAMNTLWPDSGRKAASSNLRGALHAARHSPWLLHHQRWRRLLTGLDERNGPVGHSGDRAPYAHSEYRGCRGSRRHGCLSSLRSIELPYRSQLRGGRLVAFLVSGV